MAQVDHPPELVLIVGEQRAQGVDVARVEAFEQSSQVFFVD